MKKTIFDNNSTIILIFFSSITINFISSIYFSPVFLIGIVFLAYIHLLKKEYVYTLLLLTLNILFLEQNNGFRAFSLILLTYFTYAFIVPFIKRVLSFSSLYNYLFVFFFYMGFAGIYVLNYSYSHDLLFIIFVNILIDFMIIGLFI